MATQLEQKHPALYHQTSKEQFARQLESLSASAATRDDAALLVGLLQLIASVGDGHTSVSGNYQALGFRRLPVSFYLFEDGLFIVDADTSISRLVGRRVAAFDGLPTDSVIALVSTVIAHDNEPGLRFSLPGSLVTPEILHTLGAARSRDRVTLRLTAPSGRSEDVVIPTVGSSSAVTWTVAGRVPVDSLPLYRRRANVNYWAQLIRDARTLYIAYNRCANDTADPMTRFAAQMKQLAADSGVTRVVVDFRNNSGGNSAVIAPLLTWLRELRAQRPDVQIAGVIGRRTFSSALMNAIAFKEQVKAPLYGEATGGKPNHFGEVRQIPLPTLGLVVNHSTRRWRLVEGDPLTLEPDVHVPLRSAESFQRRDPVLERILSGR